jgi:nitroreductase
MTDASVSAAHTGARRVLGARHESLRVMLERRSVPNVAEPAPTDEQLRAILAAATTVPDHGQLRPWRFVVVAGPARDVFGEALVAAAQEQAPEPLPQAATDKLRGKAYVAPMLVAVIASPKPSPKVPEWEQVASASCTGYALVLAAHALGVGAVWKSAPVLDGTALRAALGLSAGERLLGWINLGAPVHQVDRRPMSEVQLSSVVSVLGADGARAPYPED